MPKLKPRAMRERIVVPSVRSSEVACAQRSGVGHREDALQPLDFGDGLFGVHPLPSSGTEPERVKCERHWFFMSHLCVASRSASDPLPQAPSRLVEQEDETDAFDREGH
jgi:hypothetical protein